MLRNIFKEIVLIRKELQDIKLILKFQFLRNYETERKKIGDEIVISRNILPDPLEELRKEECTLQQYRKKGKRDPVVVRRKLNR